MNEALKLANKVDIIVSNNPNKNYMFSAEKRKEMIEKIFNHGFVKVHIVENDYVASYLENYNKDPYTKIGREILDSDLLDNFDVETNSKKTKIEYIRGLPTVNDGVIVFSSGRISDGKPSSRIWKLFGLTLIHTITTQK